MVLGIAAVPAQAEIGPGANPETVTKAPLPTWQTNGTVWDMAAVNGVVYVGGNFTSVRPPGAAPGTGEVSRKRLAAFDAATGNLLSWAPQATSTPFTTTSAPDTNCTSSGSGTFTVECATVWSITPTPDGKSIVVGGDFQRITESGQAAQTRAGVAAFTTSTGLSKSAPGTLNATFKPSVSGRVYSVAATNSGVWVGGSVTKAGGQTVSGLASFAFPSGTVRADFNPSVVKGTTPNTITGVRKIIVTADGSRLIVGGGFVSVAGRQINGLQAISPVDGTPVRWDTDQIANSAFITNLKIYDGVLYTTGEANGASSEGVIAYDAATGALKWFDGCRGASHSMALARGVIYVGSHSHDCGSMEGGFGEQYQNYPDNDRRRYTLRAQVPNGTASAKLLPWSPRTNDGNGARAMQFDGTNLWIGGEFTTVDSAAQQGLTRFGFLSTSGQNHKPLKPSAPAVVTSTRPGTVDVSFQETEDPDNRQLTYAVIRDNNTANPVFTTSSGGPPWAKGWMHFVDTVASGSSHTYDIRATDPLGSASSRSDQATVTVAGTASPLAELAKKDSATTRFSFDSRTSGSYVDSVSGKTGAPGSGASSGAGSGGAGNGLTLSGSSGGAVVVTAREWTTRQLSVEAMFKTSTTRGGSLVSFGSSDSTTSLGSSSTGALYMDNTGRLNFGLQPNANRPNPWNATALGRKTVTTAGTYRDDKWHHVVATFQPGNGSRIYVDGSLAAQDPSMTWTLPVNGYLRIGGDYTAGFANAPTSSWFAGSIDEVAVYKHPLSGTQISAHASRFLATSGTPGAAQPIQVVSSGSVWKYDVSGAPAANWSAASFGDSTWSSGPSQLGYGEGDEATVLTPFMPNGTTRRITTYFRTSFDRPASPPTKLSLRMKVDDGVVLYLNGKEVLRDNMPAGTVGAGTLATRDAADDGQTWRTFTIPTADLVAGRNVLAAEVHQNAASSSDLTWDAELTARFD